MKRVKLNQGVQDILKLADYFDELGQELLAQNFRRYAESLPHNLPRSEFIELCRLIHSSLDNGPGRAPDLYFAKPDGKPDIGKTDDYLTAISDVRNFARKGMFSLF